MIAYIYFNVYVSKFVIGFVLVVLQVIYFKSMKNKNKSVFS